MAGRRTAVTASGLATLVLVGCTSPDESAGAGSSASTSSAPTSSAAALDPDVEALELAIGLTTAMQDLLARGGPRLDPTGTLAALHARHLSVLDGMSGVTASPTASPTQGSAGPRPTPARLRRQEMNAQRQLARLAVQSESGPVARLLASMSAGIAAGVSQLGEVRR
jgi:hypothetical protein